MNSKSEPEKLFCTVKPNPNVIFRRLGDEIVFFHLGSDRFYELNSTASRFWQLMQEGHDFAEIRRQMLEEFAIDPHRFDAEAAALLLSLRQQDLISADE
jgi:hypothetical protein